MAGKPTTPEEYLASVPEQAREPLDEVRAAILEALPGAEESISYSILGYRLEGRIVAYCAGSVCACAAQCRRQISDQTRQRHPGVRRDSV